MAKKKESYEKVIPFNTINPDEVTLSKIYRDEIREFIYENFGVVSESSLLSSIKEHVRRYSVEMRAKIDIILAYYKPEPTKGYPSIELIMESSENMVTKYYFKLPNA